MEAQPMYLTDDTQMLTCNGYREQILTQWIYEREHTGNNSNKQLYVISSKTIADALKN